MRRGYDRVTEFKSIFQMESVLKIADIKANAYAMPFASPSYPKGPYHFVNREFFNYFLSYRRKKTA
jgi:hypothetical protein